MHSAKCARGCFHTILCYTQQKFTIYICNSKDCYKVKLQKHISVSQLLVKLKCSTYLQTCLEGITTIIPHLQSLLEMIHLARAKNLLIHISIKLKRPTTHFLCWRKISLKRNTSLCINCVTILWFFHFDSTCFYAKCILEDAVKPVKKMQGSLGRHVGVPCQDRVCRGRSGERWGRGVVWNIKTPEST